MNHWIFELLRRSLVIEYGGDYLQDIELSSFQITIEIFAYKVLK